MRIHRSCKNLCCMLWWVKYLHLSRVCYFDLTCLVHIHLLDRDILIVHRLSQPTLGPSIPILILDLCWINPIVNSIIYISIEAPLLIHKSLQNLVVLWGFKPGSLLAILRWFNFGEELLEVNRISIFLIALFILHVGNVSLMIERRVNRSIKYLLAWPNVFKLVAQI